MAKRKAGDFNTARAHVGAPHNQEFNVNARKNLTKRKSWWNGHAPRPARQAD